MQTIIFNSIDDVPESIWLGLTDKCSYTFGLEFWRLLEKSKLNDFTYRYLIFFDDQGYAVALAVVYEITTDMAIFAPRWLRHIVHRIRRFWSGFLKLRMLECGTPITLNSPGWVLRSDVSVDIFVNSLNNVLMKITKDEGQRLIVVRDFEQNSDFALSRFCALGYQTVVSLPNTYLDIVWTTPQSYLDSMRSYYRSKILKHLKHNNLLGVTHFLVDDCSGFSDELCRQWMTVHEHANEFQREVLTSEFYREFFLELGNKSKALLIYRDGELVAHALLLMDGDLLRWLYFGRNDPVNDGLYLYVAYHVIESGIILGAKRIEMGLTTYPIKLDLGARMVNSRLALKTPVFFVQPLVGWLYGLMNKLPHISSRDVFK